jgi:hypothetical protein
MNVICLHIFKLCLLEISLVPSLLITGYPDPDNMHSYSRSRIYRPGNMAIYRTEVETEDRQQQWVPIAVRLSTILSL